MNLVTYNPEMNCFQQLLFVYNAITNGWSVKQIGNGLYEFEKDISEIPTRYKNSKGTDVKDTFIFKFLKNNLSLECRIPKNTQNAFIDYSSK
jgi:hypothetical protein